MRHRADGPTTVSMRNPSVTIGLHHTITQKTLKKSRKKHVARKTAFFHHFGDFWPLRREFSTLLGAKTGPRRLLLEHFFMKNCVFKFYVNSGLFWREKPENPKNEKLAFVL